MFKVLGSGLHVQSEPKRDKLNERQKMIIQSIAGLLAFAGIAWLLSENRKQVKLNKAITGILLQLLVGLILLKIPIFRDLFLLLNRLVLSLEAATTAGTSFVFGYLGGAEFPFKEKYPGAGFIVAFRALPLILVISAWGQKQFSTNCWHIWI